MAEKIFPKGMYAKIPHEKVKEWTAALISIKVETAIEWLKENQNSGGYVNLIVKKNTNGMHIEKDTWEPIKKEIAQTSMTSVQPDGSEPINTEDIPF